MAAIPKSNLVYDVISRLDLGINSGLSPEQLPKNQAAFSSNVTFRGGFASDRPPFRRIHLSESLDAVLQEALKQGVFQGSAAYKPDGGFEQLVCAIAGRQFVITPNSSDGATGKEITISGDPNPANVLQNWLWQLERWLIFQDGQSTPIFYDGVSSRRAQTTVQLQGTVAADFANPPVGGVVSITLTDPYTGLLNSVLNLDEVDASGNVIRTAHFMVTEVNGTANQYSALLKNLSDSSASQPEGSQIVIQPQNLGNVVSYSHPSFFDWSTETATLSAAVPSYVVVGNRVQIGGNGIWKITSISSDRKTLKLKQQGTNFSGGSPLNVVLLDSSIPDSTVGTVLSDFAVPPIGSTVNVALTSAYTNADGQIVFINGGQYQVVSHATATPSSNVAVTVQNLNDSISTTIKAGSKFYNLPELPAGRMGAYGMGRNWQSGIDGITFLAGDVDGGSAGSPAFNGRDAVLKVTENKYLAGGGLFRVPGSGETITGMTFTATLDKSLGQGPLQVFTNRNIFSCNTPVERLEWQDITNPILTESLIGSGASSQYGIDNSNADVLFRSPDSKLRSLILSRLDFNRWGNTPISYEASRITNSENSDLMNFCSAIVFDNRWLVASNPISGTRGVYWEGLIALNFDNITTLQGKSPSTYDGLWTGLNILQMVAFKSVSRAFAFCYNPVYDRIEIWEILKTGTDHFDNGSVPIQWSFESPTFNFNGFTARNEGNVLQLENGDIKVSDVIGRVSFKIQYRADYDQCWHDWREWSICSKQSGPNPRPQYRKPMSFGKPSNSDCNVNTNQPPTYGDFFQIRVLIQGHCVVNRIRLAASIQPRPDFLPITCAEESCDNITCETDANAVQEYLNQYSLNRVVVSNLDYSTTINGKVYTVPAGAIEYPVNDSVFSGLTYNGCQNVITAETPEEIVSLAAQQQAQCDAAESPSPIPPPPMFLNSQTTLASGCSESLPLSITAPLPSGVTTDGNNFVLAAGVFSSNISQLDADTNAATFLSNLKTSLFDSGKALCAVPFGLKIMNQDEVGSVLPATKTNVLVRNIGGVYFMTGFVNAIYTSSDGLSWSKITIGSDGIQMADIAFGNGVYVVTCRGSGMSNAVPTTYTSTDLASWTKHNGGASTTAFSTIAFGNGVFVICTTLGFVRKSAQSVDGVSWTVAPGTSVTKLNFINGLFMTGDFGNVSTSPDGLTWTSTPSNLPFSGAWEVAYGNGVYVVGGSGYASYSTDGITWSPTSEFIGGGNMRAIAFNNGYFAICRDSNGDIFLSQDGQTWSPYSGPNTSGPIYNCCPLGASKVLCVGSS